MGVLRLLPEPEAVVWAESMSVRIEHLRRSGDPGLQWLADDIDECVRHLDFIRGELR